MCTAMHMLLVSRIKMLSSCSKCSSVNVHTATAGLSSHTSQDKFMNVVNKLLGTFPVIPGSIASMNDHLAVYFMSPCVLTVPSLTYSDIERSQRAVAHLVTCQMSKCNMSQGTISLVCGSCVWLFWPLWSTALQSLLYYAYSCDYSGVDHLYL